MKKMFTAALLMAAAVILSGCAGAAFNRIELVMNRNVTVGQELIDLQAAHEKGIISDSEYSQAKQDILNMMNQLGSLGDKD